ncbi:MAG: hypothetical protein AAF555_08165 [Verrucomicrobiota bacterium]
MQKETAEILAKALRRRLALIGDQELRERDPEGQLQALGAISQEIDQLVQTHGREITGQLRHYFAQCSYQKALTELESISAS